MTKHQHHQKHDNDHHHKKRHHHHSDEASEKKPQHHQFASSEKIANLLTRIMTVPHGKKTQDVQVVRPDAISLVTNHKSVEHVMHTIAKMCASGCSDYGCRSSGVCRHINTIDDGYRKLSANRIFYTLYFLQYVAITTIPVTLTANVTQYAYLNTDGSVDIVTYTGVVPTQPANTTAIIFPNGSGLSNQTQLGDMVIIDGVINAVGTSVGTALAANLINSKYYVSVNSPAGTFTLLPLSVDDIQVNDLVQVTNYFDASLSPLAAPGLNQVVELNAVDYYTQTTSYTVTDFSSNYPLRSIRAGYVDRDDNGCSCKNYCLDAPMGLYLRDDPELVSRLSDTGAIDASRFADGLIDLLVQPPDERRGNSAGLRWNSRTHNIERGDADDYLDMTDRDIARFLRKKLDRIHNNIITSFDSVGGVASFVF